MENADHLLKPEEVAEWLRISRRHVTDLFHQGEFPHAFQMGRAIRIPRSDVVAYIQRRKRRVG